MIGANYPGLAGPGKCMGLYSECSGKPQKFFKQESDLLDLKILFELTSKEERAKGEIEAQQAS